MKNQEINESTFYCKVVRVRAFKDNNLFFGGALWLESESGKTYKYYVKSLEKYPCDISLKTISYFLDYPFTSHVQYNHLHLIGRSCYITITHTPHYNRYIPVITGFKFSDETMYSYKGYSS